VARARRPTSSHFPARRTRQLQAHLRGGPTTAGAANGATLFTQNCASCLALIAAHAKGTVGPNLDRLKPSKAVVARQVTNGGGGMPAFGGRLRPNQIDAIATYVASSTGKKEWPPSPGVGGRSAAPRAREVTLS
jgi:mono/diheme cytochrome c family protein